MKFGSGAVAVMEFARRWTGSPQNEIAWYCGTSHTEYIANNVPDMSYRFFETS